MRLAQILAMVAVLTAGPTDRLAAQLDLGIHHTGLSIGNSREWTGIRLNFRDKNVDRVRGLNVTLWAPAGDGFGARLVEGVSLGVGPAAERLRGINLGLVAVVAEREAVGVNFGGLAAVSNGDLEGINIGGLATVANGSATGISLGGLATVANKDLSGLGFGTLAVVANGDAHGAFASLLAVVANGDLKGVGIGGLATVGRSIRGFSVSGLATVGREEVTGIHLAGLAVVGAGSITGAAVTLARTDADVLHGFAFGAYNRVRREQRGLTIGIYNKARALHGLQIGVLNHAGNARGFRRWLPIANFHR